MERNLCISVTLLDGLFHGKADGDEPEWPPSPMRLFQAVLAGSRVGCRQSSWSDAKVAAFHWLERRDPPEIVAPEAKPAAAYTLFVPNNDSDKEFERQDRLTSKLVRPQQLTCLNKIAGPQPTVHYLWSISETEWPVAQPHVELLCREARHVTALGWGIDQAVGIGRVLTRAEAARLMGQRWRPWRVHRPGQRTLRVPTHQSLENLIRVHESFVNRVDGTQFNPPSKLSRFDSVAYLRGSTLPPRPYAAFELPDGVAFCQQEAIKVAAMIRSLACDRAKRDTHEFPGGPETYVAGHAEGAKHTPPRFSYLPLPTIGHPHADGMIRRVLIAEPFGGDGSHCRWAQARLRNAVLADNVGNERGVLLDLWRSSSREVINRYVSESRIWSTVSPIILPGFDDGKHAKAERLCLQALSQACLPIEAVAELTLRKAPYWPGSRHPRQYHRPQYLKHLPAWHARIVFRERIPGPLAVGAGRHCGLGILAAHE